MFEVSRLKSLMIIFTCFIGIIFCLPNVIDVKKLPSWLQNKVNLGLELKGGSHLQFEVDLKTVERDYLKHMMQSVRSVLRQKKIGYLDLTLRHDKSGTVDPDITFSFRNDHDFQIFKKELRKIDSQLDIHLNGQQCIVSLTLDKKNIRNKQILDQSIEVIRRRVDESGTKEPNIVRQGIDRIVVELPGVDDPQEVKKLIGQTAKLEFRLVDGDPAFGDDLKPHIATDSEWLEYQDDRIPGKVQYLPIKKDVLLTGDHLSDAQMQSDQRDGAYQVSLKFDNIGSRLFLEATKKSVKKRLAIVLDQKIITAPVVNDPIPNGQASITGSFTMKEAHQLALLLRAGSLPAPLKIVEERTVGPSLGNDSIAHGKMAVIYSFVLVAVFMVLGYSLFGVFANIALVFNLIFLFSGLSLLGATLTLPGIAGIAMTIGMAVDANVLIYERIKEEMRRGLKPLMAIEAGYKRAMSTIVDSNLTTIIGGLVLYEFSSGSIRGFAVTLIIGIIVSLFTALSVTKLMTAYWFRNKTPQNSLPI
jgi:preprotein translocase subunit SecD